MLINFRAAVSAEIEFRVDRAITFMALNENVEITEEITRSKRTATATAATAAAAVAAVADAAMAK